MPHWGGTWQENLALARMADDAGLDFMLPLGRWRGYGGETDHNGVSLETLIWAAGILASTSRIRAFGTVHVTLFNPVLAAKQMATVDQIGGGRFGLNIVCGWYEDEFGMFGVDLGQVARRYDQGQEWLDIVTRLWTQDAPFDFDGEFFHLRSVVGWPKPVQKPRPPIFSAGSSVTGRAFAMRNADIMFTGLTDITRAEEELAALRADIAASGRDVGIYSSVYVICRPTRQEAEDYHRHFAVEMADAGAVETMLVGRGHADPDVPDEIVRQMRLRLAGGNGGYPIIGTPDEVAEHMRRLNEIGFDGLAMGMQNYLEHLPFFRDEVLPRLQRMGVRG